MFKKFLSCLMTLFIFITCIIPAFALHEETTKPLTTEPTTYSDKGCSIIIRGIIDKKSLSPDAGIILYLRNLTTGDEYMSALYSFNDYFDTLEIERQGEFEIYKAYIVGGESINDLAANIEYVRFKCNGRASITVPILIGDLKNIDQDIPDDGGVRVNDVGSPYLNYPTSVNIKYKTEDGKVEEVKETVTVPTFSYSNESTQSYSGGDVSPGETANNSNEAGDLVEPQEKIKSVSLVIVIIFTSTCLIIIGIFVALKKKHDKA